MKEDTMFQEYLKPTEFIDFDTDIIQEFVKKHTNPTETQTQQAIQLYYAVRDSIRYNPYGFALSRKKHTASQTLIAKESWCIPKSTVYAACCRAIGVPARLGFADVKNHLSTGRMREWLQDDVFAWHGYTLVYLEGKWVKATPVFNIELCDKFGLQPLEFDGKNDSIYHAFDKKGQQHMEYVLDRGIFSDVPFDLMCDSLKDLYPQLKTRQIEGNFEEDVVAEVDHRLD